jgi:hypothetical protein
MDLDFERKLSEEQNHAPPFINKRDTTQFPCLPTVLMFTDGFEVIGDPSAVDRRIVDRQMDDDGTKNSTTQSWWKHHGNCQTLVGVVFFLLLVVGVQYWMTTAIMDKRIEAVMDARIEIIRQDIQKGFLQIMSEGAGVFTVEDLHHDDNKQWVEHTTADASASTLHLKTGFQQIPQDVHGSSTDSSQRDHHGGYNNAHLSSHSSLWSDWFKFSGRFFFACLQLFLDTLVWITALLIWIVGRPSGENSGVGSDGMVVGLYAVMLAAIVVYVFFAGFRLESTDESAPSSPHQGGTCRRRRSSSTGASNGRGRRKRTRNRSGDDGNGYSTSDDEEELTGRTLFPDLPPRTPPRRHVPSSLKEFTSPIWKTRNRVERGLDTPGRCNLSKREHLAVARANARKAYEEGRLGK